MFLMMGTMLGIVSTMTEVMLVHGAPWIDTLYVKGLMIRVPGRSFHIRGIWFNTAGSFILSYVLGLMFSADGLTVLFGAALSTGMSQVYFSCEKFAKDMGWSWTKMKNSVSSTSNSLANSKAAVQNTWADFREPVKDFGKLVLAFLKIITAPLRWIRAASVAYTNART